MNYKSSRCILATAFLLMQIGFIVYARFVEARYFCWAPYDAQNEYRLEVTVDGKRLSNEDIYRRYRISADNLESRSAAHVKNIVSYAEERYYDDGAKTVMYYKVNGVVQTPWCWPENKECE